MTKLKEYKLSDVADFIDYRGKTPKKISSGVPLITAKIVKNGWIQKPNEFISKDDYLTWMTRGFPKVGDVVLTTEAPLGEVAQIKDASFALAQRIITIRGKDNLIENGYLKYFLQSSIGQHRLKERETGTTVTGIKSSELRQVLISAPDFQTQTSIAEILSSLDDKIELNNKINQELETLAQTLFKQWFIDFEFPNENGEPYKSSGGEMEDSELGEIPKGWLVKRLDEISSEITRGYTTKYVEKSSIINLNQKVNRGVHLDKSNFKYYPNDTVVPENKFARQKDILINSLGQGTLGRIHFYKENSTNVVIDQHITILRGNNEQFLPEILYLMLTFSSNQKRLEEMDYDGRKSLFDYDEILNKQRNVIYYERRKILESGSVKTKIGFSQRTKTKDI
jgi:restriction endonuclease S subunit